MQPMNHDDDDDDAGHVLGNFPKYYMFNPPEQRTIVLPESFWIYAASKISKDQPIELLDIGCNTGELTHAMAQGFIDRCPEFKVQAYGVDIDAELIRQAQLTFPQWHFVADDFVLHNCNIFGKTQFDIVCCFGVTMWVHLNHGDDGLVHLLERMCEMATVSLIVEPQTWINYKKAKKRLRKQNCTNFPKFMTSISSGQQNISNLLHKTCDKYFDKCIVHGTTKWGREVIEFTDKRS